MAIYDYLGNALSACYDVDGNVLSAAYDVDGNQIFSSGSDSPLTLKVMTYNVGQWYIGNGTFMSAELDPAFYELQYGTFQRNAVDICGIEEYTAKFSNKPRQASEVVSPFFNYTSLKNYDSNYYYGHGFATKYPLSNFVENSYSVGTSYYYKADINVGGKTIALVVTHLGTQTVQRVEQIPVLLQYLNSLYAPNGASGAKVPVICLGDFNMNLVRYPDERSLYYNFCSSTGFGMVNQNYNPDGVPPASDTDFEHFHDYFGRFYSTMASGEGLDNILFSPNIEFVSAYVDTAKQNVADQSIFTDLTKEERPLKLDHMPLIATLTIN